MDMSLIDYTLGMDVFINTLQLVGTYMYKYLHQHHVSFISFSI